MKVREVSGRESKFVRESPLASVRCPWENQKLSLKVRERPQCVRGEIKIRPWKSVSIREVSVGKFKFAIQNSIFKIRKTLKICKFSKVPVSGQETSTTFEPNRKESSSAIFSLISYARSGRTYLLTWVRAARQCKILAIYCFPCIFLSKRNSTESHTLELRSRTSGVRVQIFRKQLFYHVWSLNTCVSVRICWKRPNQFFYAPITCFFRKNIFTYI